MDDSQSELYQAVANIYYRGIHKGPETVTLTQAIFVFPLLEIAVMYLPKIVYILILNVRKAGNGVKISEHAVLFVYPNTNILKNNLNLQITLNITFSRKV